VVGHHTRQRWPAGRAESGRRPVGAPTSFRCHRHQQQPEETRRTTPRRSHAVLHGPKQLELVKIGNGRTRFGRPSAPPTRPAASPPGREANQLHHPFSSPIRKAFAGRRHHRLLGRSTLLPSPRTTGQRHVTPAFPQLGRNQLRVSFSPAVDPDDVSALTTASIGSSNSSDLVRHPPPRSRGYESITRLGAHKPQRSICWNSRSSTRRRWQRISRDLRSAKNFHPSSLRGVLHARFARRGPARPSTTGQC